MEALSQFVLPLDQRVNERQVLFFFMSLVNRREFEVLVRLLLVF